MYLGVLFESGAGDVQGLDRVARSVPQRRSSLGSQPLALFGDLVPPAGHVRGQFDLFVEHMDMDRLRGYG